MSKVIPRRLSLCAVAALLATACTTTSTPPPATPAPVPRTSDSGAVHAPPPAVARWTPKHEPGSWRYELHSTGTVSLAGDTTADSLPVARTIIYSVSITPPAPTNGPHSAFQLSGSVDSVAVTIPERIPTPTAGSNSKPHFQGDLATDGHLIALSSNATTPCQNAVDPLSAAAASLFVTLPQGIAPNQRWADTVSTITCRGRMPLETTVIRQYTAITDTVWQGRAALRLARHDSLTIRNRPDSSVDSVVAPNSTAIDSASRDSTETMDATGSGHADFTLYVDPRSGVLLHAAGASDTQILVMTSGSRFPFREEAHQTITLLR